MTIRRNATLDRVIGFVVHVSTRRVPTRVSEIARDTGYCERHVRRLLSCLQRHVAIDVTDGVVTVRKPLTSATRPTSTELPS